MTKTVIITGASRGIGAATAKLAGERGWRVCVNYNSSPDKADEVVNAINSGGGEAFAMQGNAGVETDILALYQAVDERWGGVDAVIAGFDLMGSCRGLVHQPIRGWSHGCGNPTAAEPPDASRYRPRHRLLPLIFPWYNTEHRHGGISMLTPHDVHHGRAQAMIEQRRRILENAWAAHPDVLFAGVQNPVHFLKQSGLTHPIQRQEILYSKLQR